MKTACAVHGGQSREPLSLCNQTQNEQKHLLERNSSPERERMRGRKLRVTQRREWEKNWNLQFTKRFFRLADVQNQLIVEWSREKHSLINNSCNYFRGQHRGQTSEFTGTEGSKIITFILIIKVSWQLHCADDHTEKCFPWWCSDFKTLKDAML